MECELLRYLGLTLPAWQLVAIVLIYFFMSFIFYLYICFLGVFRLNKSSSSFDQNNGPDGASLAQVFVARPCHNPWLKNNKSMLKKVANTRRWMGTNRLSVSLSFVELIYSEGMFRRDQRHLELDPGLVTPALSDKERERGKKRDKDDS